jgi:hypothetical protein
MPDLGEAVVGLGEFGGTWLKVDNGGNEACGKNDSKQKEFRGRI